MILRRLWQWVVDYFAWSVPEEVSRDMPQTYAEFRAQRGQEYPHTTGSPINRRAS